MVSAASDGRMPLRIITGSAICDGHDAAINIFRRILQSQGCEVIHLGHNRSVAEAVDAAPIDRFSLEDAHRPNDLAALLPRFTDTTVILGCVAIARSRVETVAEVRGRLLEALRHIDRDRLIAAPDCGLGYLGRDLAMAKLRVLVEAAASV